MALEREVLTVRDQSIEESRVEESVSCSKEGSGNGRTNANDSFSMCLEEEGGGE